MCAVNFKILHNSKYVLLAQEVGTQSLIRIQSQTNITNNVSTILGFLPQVCFNEDHVPFTDSITDKNIKILQ